MPAVQSVALVGGNWLTADAGAAMFDGKPARRSRIARSGALSINITFSGTIVPRIVALLGLSLPPGVSVTAAGATGTTVRLPDGSVCAWLSPGGPWQEVVRTTETRYLYSDGSGLTWYFRITATVRGVAGGSEIVVGTPELVARQEAVDAAVESAAQANLKAAEALALFGTKYSPATAYSVDTVVYKDGRMYRAKQAVPAGMQPPNATYWQDVGTVTEAQGASTLAVRQLRTDVDAQGQEFAAAIDQVSITAAASGMEWQANYIRIYGNGYQLVMGTGFGSQGNLVQWFGANIGAANCTTANCIECKTTAGQTFIRGSNAQGSMEIMNTLVTIRDNNNVKRVEFGLLVD